MREFQEFASSPRVRRTNSIICLGGGFNVDVLLFFTYSNTMHVPVAVAAARVRGNHTSTPAD